MKPANIKPNVLVKVTWTDSAYEQGWVYRKTPSPLPDIITVGFVTHCTPSGLEVAGSVGTTGLKGALNPLGLPWGMIKSVQVLERG